jgi:uncharacterized protein (DUF111 family)
MLQREMADVQTQYGPVRVKIAWLGDVIVNVKPEYEDCRELSRRLDLPLKDILSAARHAAWQMLQERPATPDS